MLWSGIVAVAAAVVCAANVALAQGPPIRDPEPIDPYPLRPPDTSSPRATLQSFLASADLAIAEWRRGSVDARGFRNILNATETLDLSSTLGAESFTAQIGRMLMLKELLDRIELPPMSSIPDAREVASGAITQWTIPQTRITIAKITEGPRAGEFLFSARTVERLDQFYRLAKDLPYKPTATTPGVFEDFKKFRGSSLLDELRNRLLRIDASSPRATLVGFLDSINEAHALIADARARLKADPPEITREAAQKAEAKARNLLSRATALLDLSKVPEAYRDDVGVGVALQLKEVLDRTGLPLPEAVPDEQMLEAARRRGDGVAASDGDGYRWRYPNTEIEITEVTQGPRRGQFLFSADTVNRIPDFYAKVRELPYRGDRSSSDSSRFYWSPESKGFYLDYIASPGYLVPELRWLGRLVGRLPPAFNKLYLEQTLWQWLALFVSALAAAAAGAVLFRSIKRVAGRLELPAKHWTMVLPPVLAAFIVRWMLDFAHFDINITGNVLRVVVALGDATVAVLAVWAVLRLGRAIADTLVSSPKIREDSHDASLIRIGVRIIAFLAGGLIVVYSLQNLGANVLPLLAGLGIGGLAIALAAQRTFANLIGSLILFVNRPVRVGDFCRYGDQIGTVENIGLLATRIRSLERTIVTVPNAEFSETKIDNFAMRDQRLLKIVLQLRYETTAEQIRYVLARLRQLLLGHPKVTPAPARVRFVGYGSFSKDLEVFAYLDCADQDTFLAIQEDILLRMEDIVNEAGSGFAFPSQTAYLARDKGVDTKRQSEAEARVEEWRRRGRLPFPNFEDRERHRYEDVLDYPPWGSPDYVPRKAASARPTGPTAALSSEDLADLPALAAKLRGRFTVFEFLRSRLSEATSKRLAGYDGGRDEELKAALVRDFNEVILGPPIYDEKRFSEVDLGAETRELLARNPEGEDLALLNRRLLDDALLNDLALKREAS